MRSIHLYVTLSALCLGSWHVAAGRWPYLRKGEDDSNAEAT